MLLRQGEPDIMLSVAFPTWYFIWSHCLSLHQILFNGVDSILESLQLQNLMKNPDAVQFKMSIFHYFIITIGFFLWKNCNFIRSMTLGILYSILTVKGWRIFGLSQSNLIYILFSEGKYLVAIFPDTRPKSGFKWALIIYYSLRERMLHIFSMI